MNYIYDIVLNFNAELFDFYEWEKDDNVEFFLKIPIFKVEENTINDFIKSSIKVEKSFLQKIANKTEKYSKNSVVVNKYSCVFVSDDKVLAMKFNDNGMCISKSNLGIDEEIDVLEYGKLIKYSIISYKVLNQKSGKNCFRTRKETKQIRIAKKQLESIYENKEYDKLKFLFYEVYNQKIENNELMYKKLSNLIVNSASKVVKISNILNKIYA